jgi:hypothetical protein
MPFLGRFSNSLLISKPFRILSEPAPAIFYIGTIGYDNDQENSISNIAIDASGNTYMCGYESGSADNCLIMKLNSSGVIQWQKKLVLSSMSGFLIKLDSNRNVYVRCSNNTIIKYNTSGTLQWQKQISSSSSFSSMDVDSSGNIYLASYNAFMKLNSSGVIQYQYINNDITATSFISAIKLDGNGNIYHFNTITNNGITGPMITKYNNSGVIQWQKRLDLSSLFGFTRTMTVDVNGNVYVVTDRIGEYNSSWSTFVSQITVVKFDTSGAQLWAKQFNQIFNSHLYSKNIIADSLGNVYIQYDEQLQFSDQRYFPGIIKLNGATGDTTFIRYIGSYSGTYSPHTNRGTSIIIDNSNDIVITSSSNINRTGSGATSSTYFSRYKKEGTPFGTTVTVGNRSFNITNYASYISNTTETISSPSATLTNLTSTSDTISNVNATITTPSFSSVVTITE